MTDTDTSAPAGNFPTLADVVAALERRYPPGTAEPWDAVGLVAGDPSQPVRHVLFAVDPTAAVVDEAIAWGADLLVTHHPLLLRPVHSVAATTFKGAVLHRLIRAGVALHVAHTNADAADGGVAHALAQAVGLVDLEPLIASPGEPFDKHVVFVPEADADAVVDAEAEELGLDERVDELPSQLSSGQRRRLALAAAFVRPARMVVLDEPERRLDAGMRTRLAERLARRRDDGAAILFACHDADFLRIVADFVLLLGDETATLLGPDDAADALPGL